MSFVFTFDSLSRDILIVGFFFWLPFGTLSVCFRKLLETPRFITSNNFIEEVFVIFRLFNDVLTLLDPEHFLVVSQFVRQKLSTHLPLAKIVDQNAIDPLHTFPISFP